MRVVARMRGRHRTVRPETGASLIIALAMVTLISVALVAALGFGTSSLRTVAAISDQRAKSYSADAALQTAIGALRADATAGSTAAGTACPSEDSAAAGTAPAVAVTCQVVASKGTGGPGDTMPSYAILALGTSASEAGVDLTPTGTVTVKGPVGSNSPGAGSPNSVAAGTLDVSGFTLDAAGTCSGTITVTTSTDKRCSTGATIADPNYPSQVSADPPNLTLPNPTPICAATNAVLQFVPGYYTDDRVFQTPAYTQGTHTCTTNYLYFRPGVYYFDFGFDPAFTDLVWDVAASQFIVGGEAKGWDPNTANSLPATPTGGTSVACKTAAEGANSGVQFVFGGSSQMVVTTSAAKVELCADPTPSGTNQQIAIYGQPTGTDAATVTVRRVPTGATPTPSSGWSGLSPTNNVLPISPATSAIDTKIASYTLASAPGGTTASINLTGYPGATSAVPAGAGNTTYALEVAHQETASAANTISSLQATITPAGGGTTCVATATKHNTTTLTAPVTDSIPLTTAACKAAVASDGFSIVYAATAGSNKTFTENLDGVELVISYTPAGVRAESGCTLAGGGCYLITAGGTSTRFIVWGTVYSPLAAIFPKYTATGVFEFRRGVVVRAVVNNGTPPADSTGSFCLGSSGAPCAGPTPRALLITASVGGTVKARALVRFVDAPVLGKVVRILSWNVIRG